MDWRLLAEMRLTESTDRELAAIDTRSVVSYMHTLHVKAQARAAAPPHGVFQASNGFDRRQDGEGHDSTSSQ